MNTTLTDELEQELSKVVENALQSKDALLPCLRLVQKHQNYISDEAVSYLARKLSLSRAYIYGVASFYGMLSREKQGENIIRVCNSLSCNISGSETLLQLLERELGIKAGETTPDGKITLEKVACLGLCDKAPVMLVNDKIYGALDEAKAKEIINSLGGK